MTNDMEDDKAWACHEHVTNVFNLLERMVNEVVKGIDSINNA